MMGVPSLEVKAMLGAPEVLGEFSTHKAQMFMGHRIQNASEELSCEQKVVKQGGANRRIAQCKSRQ